MPARSGLAGERREEKTWEMNQVEKGYGSTGEKVRRRWKVEMKAVEEQVSSWRPRGFR